MSTGVRKAPNGLEYLIKWRNESILEHISNDDVCRKIPMPIATFLEQKVELFQQIDHADNVNQNELPQQCENPTGDPIRVHCMYRIISHFD